MNENLQGIQYELCMMGIPIDSAIHIYRDSVSVNNNMSKLKSIIQNNENSVCHHTVCKYVAIGESLFAHIIVNENPANFLTKISYSGKRKYLENNILHYVYNGKFMLHACAELASTPMYKY